MNLAPTTRVPLHGGAGIPIVGLGVFKTRPGHEVERAVTVALETGYRHIDTATLYSNEEGVGKAVAAFGIARSEVFITTKVWNTDQGYERTLAAMDASLERLGTEYVDLYLVHWPKPALTAETWRAMEVLQREGKARAIGVSNFLPHHLEQLAETAEVMPSINQIEFHPHLQSPDVVDYCRRHGIVVEAWSPLKRGAILDAPMLEEIAARHGVSVAQAVIRWTMQRGIVAIPKSVTPARIVENFDVFGFELTGDEMAAIDAMDRDERIGPHPDRIDF